ncbi:MAG: dTDP-4-dehydrorhamnose 3,5-epimerase [Pseudomonadota bacterium]
MQITPTEIPDVKIILPRRNGDQRGFFSEVYNRRDWIAAGLDVDFVQDNHSLSRQKGTLRGLHFQIPPHPQGKLVRVARGAILDVAVDIRKGSHTYGRWVSVELSVENWRQLWVPAGFAHGFCTLEPDTEVLYKVSGFYDPDHERGLAWDDPQIGIAWPSGVRTDLLTGKDRQWPTLRELPDYFTFNLT